ncbi:hypothetical protein ACIA8K_15830 [Catenuloplanes sp. NPDC051500]|uniref:WXG100-like domain-containing protein n=1 Tax=Catenuloplanes sp. NPDC051500 TaxID=3363959 RepID=UPI0037B87F06
MTITLDPWLAEPLALVGLEWPEGDEDALARHGQAWLDYGTALRAQGDEANATAMRVWRDNEGESIEAFERFWNGDDGPGTHLADAAAAADVIGTALIAMSGFVLWLKGRFVAELTALAWAVGAAIAAAFFSGGVAALAIAALAAISREVLRGLIDEVLGMIETEILAQLRQVSESLRTAEPEPAPALPADPELAFQELLRQAETVDVSTPPNGATFWSGVAPDGTSLQDTAEANTDGVNTVTIEQTPGGGYFDELDLFSANSPVTMPQAQQIWETLSTRYAEGATGTVTAYVHNPRPGSVWTQHELEALRNNPHVTDIRIIDPYPS